MGIRDREGDAAGAPRRVGRGRAGSGDQGRAPSPVVAMSNPPTQVDGSKWGARARHGTRACPVGPARRGGSWPNLDHRPLGRPDAGIAKE